MEKFLECLEEFLKISGAVLGRISGKMLPDLLTWRIPEEIIRIIRIISAESLVRTSVEVLRKISEQTLSTMHRVILNYLLRCSRKIFFMNHGKKYRRALDKNTAILGRILWRFLEEFEEKFLKKNTIKGSLRNIWNNSERIHWSLVLLLVEFCEKFLEEFLEELIDKCLGNCLNNLTRNPSNFAWRNLMICSWRSSSKNSSESPCNNSWLHLWTHIREGFGIPGFV